MQQQLLPGSTVLRFLVLSEANIKVLLYEHEIMLISRFNLLSVSFAQFCFVVIFANIKVEDAIWWPFSLPVD
jgi:hypothetical protein